MAMIDPELLRPKYSTEGLIKADEAEMAVDSLAAQLGKIGQEMAERSITTLNLQHWARTRVDLLGKSIAKIDQHYHLWDSPAAHPLSQIVGILIAKAGRVPDTRQQRGQKVDLTPTLAKACGALIIYLREDPNLAQTPKQQTQTLIKEAQRYLTRIEHPESIRMIRTAMMGVKHRIGKLIAPIDPQNNQIEQQPLPEKYAKKLLAAAAQTLGDWDDQLDMSKSLTRKPKVAADEGRQFPLPFMGGEEIESA